MTRSTDNCLVIFCIMLTMSGASGDIVVVVVVVVVVGGSCGGCCNHKMTAAIDFTD